jgi:hypothetical protein
MTILHYLVVAAALVAAAGMLAVSYLAAVMVWERKQPLLCMDSAPCKYRTDEYCSIKERITHFFMEIVPDGPIGSAEEMLVKFHCDKREEGKIEALIKMDVHRELSSDGEALKNLEEIVTQRFTEKMKEWWEKETQRLERELLYGNSNRERPEGLIRCGKEVGD